MMNMPILRLAQCALAIALPVPLTQCGSLSVASGDRPSVEPHAPAILVEAAPADDEPVASVSGPVPGGDESVASVSAPEAPEAPLPTDEFRPELVGFSPSQDRQSAEFELTAAHGIPTRGIGSFYRVRTNGTRTASGVPLKDSVSTAAHRTLPFGTLVRVTNLKNGQSEVVKVTDRGPFTKGRIIDVSLNAAEKLGMIKSGIVPVEIEVLSRRDAT